MKKNYLLLFIGVLTILASCEKEENNKIFGSACSTKDPAKNLPWLKNLIKIAEDDRINKTYKGRYLGTIYLEMFEGKEVFYYYEPLSSCMFCSVYYCDGSKVEFNDSNITVFIKGLKKDKIIYSNMP